MADPKRTPRDFKTSLKRREPIPFTLDGGEHVYTFKPPKSAKLILGISMADDDTERLRNMLDWLSSGLGEEDNERVIARLQDADDDFDFEDLEPVIEWLVEETTGGRPTT